MILPLAAGVVPPFLIEIVFLVASAAAVAYVCHRIGLVPIVGFLLAGVLIGPNALGLVRAPELIDAAAEVGVLLLLFTIGIEFSLEKLGRIQRLIFVGGGLQVGLVTALVAGGMAAFGFDWKVGVYSGFLVALSSTAIVTKLLGDRGETGTAAGQGAVGLLIFQDLAIIVMVLLVPALGGDDVGGLDVAWALTKAGLIIALVLVVARRLLPPLLERVARTCSPELFLLTVVAICLGTAALVGAAGVSIALGAFLAGLVVSQSRFSEHAMSEIMPLQILFSATFFVSVGLMLDVGFMLTNLPLVLAVIAGIFVLKLLTSAAALRIEGRPLPVAAASALLLAQVGEFSFVLEHAGREAGLAPFGMGESGSQAFVAATVVLMAATPVLAPYASRLAKRIQAHSNGPAPSDEGGADPGGFADLEHHVIVAGYGSAARHLVRVLDGSGVPFVIVTLSPDGAREAESEGRRVLRGDYGRLNILQTVGLDRAKLLVVPDDSPNMAHRVVRVARTSAPTIQIVACTSTTHDAAELLEAGADRVIAMECEAIVGLFGDILEAYQVDGAEILRHEEALRRGNYLAFDASSELAPAVVCDLDDDCLGTRVVTVRAGAPIVGQRAADLDLDALTLDTVERDGWTAAPDDDLALREGDRLTLRGSAEAFRAAGDLFRATPDAAQESGDPEASGSEPASDDAPRADWIDLDTPVAFSPRDGSGCTHTDQVRDVVPGTQGCAECLRDGTRWVHLRVCMTCGHVGCCDSSEGRHATAHFHETGHAIVRSIEPGEDWGWCYEDEKMV